MRRRRKAAMAGPMQPSPHAHLPLAGGRRRAGRARPKHGGAAPRGDKTPNHGHRDSNPNPKTGPGGWGHLHRATATKAATPTLKQGQEDGDIFTACSAANQIFLGMGARAAAPCWFLGQHTNPPGARSSLFLEFLSFFPHPTARQRARLGPPPAPPAHRQAERCFLLLFN